MPADPLAQTIIFAIAAAGITAGSIILAEFLTRPRPRKSEKTP